MAYADSLSAIVDAVIDGDDDAFNAASRALPLTPERAAPRGALGDQQRKRIYDRDHYQCRYCGSKLVLREVLTLLSVVDPVQFPWHSNWKTGSIHPTFPMTIPTVDHVVPIVLGGTDDDDNLVTACWPCNQRKGDLPLTLPLVDPADSTWCGADRSVPHAVEQGQRTAQLPTQHSDVRQRAWLVTPPSPPRRLYRTQGNACRSCVHGPRYTHDLTNALRAVNVSGTIVFVTTQAHCCCEP